ncbi:unnamed protein product [Closterium sp. Naga37s-1]|nr:unnamed protein product [Closterium sp. Naga37s-1]
MRPHSFAAPIFWAHYQLSPKFCPSLSLPSSRSLVSPPPPHTAGSRSWRGRWRGASWRADRGSILVDAVRVLAQLRAETSQLRGSAEHMSEQIQELKAEKSELREERARLLANKQQLEDEVRRLTASGAAQSTTATSAAVSVVSSTARQTAAISPPLGFAPCAPGSPGLPGAVPVMLHPVSAASGAAAAVAAGGGSAGSAGAAAATPGPQYLHVPAMPYAMPGMSPMGMWQWLSQPAVEPYDQKLRTLVV